MVIANVPSHERGKMRTRANFYPLQLYLKKPEPTLVPRAVGLRTIDLSNESP